MLEYLNDVLLALEVYEDFLLACFFWLKCLADCRHFLVLFWPAHWYGTLPAQANKVVVQGRQAHKSFVFGSWPSGRCFSKSRGCFTVPLLDLCWKLSPGYQKKKLYLVHVKLDTAEKCNWAIRWIQKKAFSRQKGDTLSSLTNQVSS